MIARVVWRRDRASLAIGSVLVATFALTATLLDDVSGLRAKWIPLGPIGYGVVTALFLLVALGPWLVRRERARAVRVLAGEGSLAIGSRVVRARDVTAFSVVRAARGLSVAIAFAKRLVFLEVGGEDEAAAITRALDRSAEAPPDVVLPCRRRAFAAAQALTSVVLAVLAPLYFLGAVRVLPSSAKPAFGISSLVVAALAVILFTVRRRSYATVTRASVSTLRRGELGASAWDAHAAIHLSGESVPIASLGARDGAKHVASLRRGEEPAASWLARLDASPEGESAYRGEALPRDVLLGVLADDEAPADARMGAARVLHRRHGEPREALRVVDDLEVHVRVEAALEEEVEVAGAALDRLGPIFRAR